jgi:hypothetical protein
LLQLFSPENISPFVVIRRHVIFFFAHGPNMYSFPFRIKGISLNLSYLLKMPPSDLGSACMKEQDTPWVALDWFLGDPLSQPPFFIDWRVPIMDTHPFKLALVPAPLVHHGAGSLGKPRMLNAVCNNLGYCPHSLRPVGLPIQCSGHTIISQGGKRHKQKEEYSQGSLTRTETDDL